MSCAKTSPNWFQLASLSVRWMSCSSHSSSMYDADKPEKLYCLPLVVQTLLRKLDLWQVDWIKQIEQDLKGKKMTQTRLKSKVGLNKN